MIGADIITLSFKEHFQRRNNVLVVIYQCQSCHRSILLNQTVPHHGVWPFCIMVFNHGSRHDKSPPSVLFQ